ncbi:2035_t:CDS:2 [Paraglomus occultum]|uniref:2035_t:CDS:1 n=1 Tax=Paraglomus occultum TaxID=144539 RepID=A0A9N9FG78_9GLOM|nr:2035_t:CDS:2 [Paraglomus occultum]
MDVRSLFVPACCLVNVTWRSKYTAKVGDAISSLNLADVEVQPRIPHASSTVRESTEIVNEDLAKGFGIIDKIYFNDSRVRAKSIGAVLEILKIVALSETGGSGDTLRGRSVHE